MLRQDRSLTGPAVPEPGRSRRSRTPARSLEAEGVLSAVRHVQEAVLVFLLIVQLPHRDAATDQRRHYLTTLKYSHPQTTHRSED